MTTNDTPDDVPWASPSWRFLFHAVVLAVMGVAITLRESHPEYPGAGLIAFALLSWLPLLARRRWPLASLSAVIAVECLHLILLSRFDPEASQAIWAAAYQPVPVGTMAAVYSFAARRPQRSGWIAGVAAATVLLAVAWLTQPHRLVSTDLVMVNLILLAAAGGVAVTARRDFYRRRARRGREDAQRMVVAERLRIARDLHDVLAHHLTLVNSQAAVADYLLASNPVAASTALRDITTHTRKALDELRATVGLLRQDSDPAGESSAGTRAPVPGLEHLDDLLTSFRAVGNPVTVSVTGEPHPLAAAADVAAYRIIQEALTNAAKHAPGAPVQVMLRWSASRLALTVENGPGVRRPVRGTGSGLGLIGMRERATSAGGQLTTQQTPIAGFRVSAVLPTNEAAAEELTL